MASKLKYTVAGGLLLRLALFSVPSLSTVLDSRVEITTPVSSYKRLLEGLFHYSHGVSPYDGGLYHQSPLFLALFSTLQDFVSPSIFAVNLLYSLVDIVAALALSRIARSLNANKPGSVFPPWTIALMYLFNPLVLLGTLSRSTNIFSNTLVLLAIAAALNKKAVQSMILLGLATTLTLYPLYLAPALILLAHQAQNQSTLLTQSIKLATVLFASFVMFVYLGFVTAGGSWEFLNSSYGIVLFYTDLTPNIGMWWYFFGEMFEFFRPFFTCVFHIYSFIFSLPVTVRFQKEPLFAIATIVGITATFKAYPEVGDVGFYFSLLALFRPMFKHLKYPVLVLLVMLYSLALAPTFYHLWINLGSGNSNFFYAITLVYALGMIIALTDTIWVALRLEYDGGKNPRLSQI